MRHEPNEGDERTIDDRTRGLGGAEPQLAIHVAAALRLGVAPAELLALCEHVSVYAGFPRALNAVRRVDRVLTDAGLTRPACLVADALDQFLPLEDAGD